ncbi:MAG: four-carbon acid sugar kinase family protein [Chitinophagaceae bacterium]|jgi:uncharacterized protein YgbK (DUF1537 family)|nr:four-carbon acid sugar kinase family protein [Chitinophagaceae bacterium]
MIIVVADDFTGAAELAGIALRFGMQLTVYVNADSLNDVPTNSAGCIVNTDSRSMKKQDALLVTKKVFKHLASQPVSIFYKKIDSVLRGYVMDELNIQMQQLGLQKAIIAPANPSLGRTIEQGKYFINRQEITTTGFVNDPEFPIKSSLVKEILNDAAIEFLQYTDTMPQQGNVVAATSTNEDLQAWANKMDNSFALAGAGDFFTALLEKQFVVKEQSEAHLRKPFLFVAGSAFEAARNRVQQWKNKAINVVAVDSYFELIQTSDEYFVLAVQDNINQISALELRTAMGKAVQQLVKQLSIQELFIEGGSTAASVLAALDITSLKPINELSRGVVRMSCSPTLEGLGVASLFITVKPGSYPLNEKILAHR